MSSLYDLYNIIIQNARILKGSDFVDELINLINTTGFPIVMCGIMFKMLISEKEARRLENESFIKILENNTNALERLTNIIERGDRIGESDTTSTRL